MDNNLERLNRLRVNAGKTELKSWKASQAKLDAAVQALIDAGASDVLPGANVDAAPVTNDPEVLAARAEPEKDEADEVLSLADSALSKNIDNAFCEHIVHTRGAGRRYFSI